MIVPDVNWVLLYFPLQQPLVIFLVDLSAVDVLKCTTSLAPLGTPPVVKVNQPTSFILRTKNRYSSPVSVKKINEIYATMVHCKSTHRRRNIYTNKFNEESSTSYRSSTIHFPTKIEDRGNGNYEILYTPSIKDLHPAADDYLSIAVTVGGKDVNGSPFDVRVETDYAEPIATIGNGELLHTPYRVAISQETGTIYVADWINGIQV